jgi:hypothetical protein
MWQPADNALRGKVFQKKVLIIQTSPPHTGSTLLVNLLHGLFEGNKDKKIIFLRDDLCDDSWGSGAGEITILKSHDINIDGLINKYGAKYSVFFVCSERPLESSLIEVKYKSYRNVISFYYNELNETLQNPLTKIVSKVGGRVFAMLRGYTNATINVQNGIKRVLDMNAKYNEIKGFPFSYIDDFYEIHGSHRGRT